MTESSMSSQWLRRYKLFFLIGLLLLGIQLLLGYLLPIFGTSDDIFNSNSASLYNGLVDDQNVRKNKAAFSELFQEENLSFDDEDIINSNPIVSFNNIAGVGVPKIVVASSAKGGMTNGNTNINHNSLNANSIANGSSKHQMLISNLKLGDLKFKPTCDILAKEAISAVYRAQTQHCKETIVNITCAIQNGKFYPTKLPNQCPHEPYSENRALGCYKDDKKFRTLSGYYINFKTKNTPQKCIQLCLQSGFVYAGVQYS